MSKFVPGNQTAANLSPLTAGHQYQFAVRAWGPGGPGQATLANPVTPFVAPTPAPSPWLVERRRDPAALVSAFEVEFGEYNGWYFGEGPWQIDAADGFADMMELSTQDAQIPGDGEVFGEDWEKKRVLTMEFGTGLALLEQCFPRRPGIISDVLMEARCAMMRRGDDGDLPLSINDQWVIMARPRVFKVPQRRGSVRTVNVSWEAEDPALYAQELQHDSTTTETVGEGRTYPRPSGSPGTVAGSWRYPDAGRSGLMVARNRGCRRTFPIARIGGPIEGPILVNERVGQRIEFNLNLGPQEWLDVDFRRGRVMLNGLQSRYELISRESVFWSIRPGENPIRLLTRGEVTNAVAQIWWRSAW